MEHISLEIENFPLSAKEITALGSDPKKVELAVCWRAIHNSIQLLPDSPEQAAVELKTAWNIYQG